MQARQGAASKKMKYSRTDEEKLRTWDLVREWTRSGLLSPSSEAAIEADLRTDLRRTNPFLRAVLFVFTCLIVAASIALVAIQLDIDDKFPAALLCFVSAATCFALAEYLISRFRLYRFGAEEALAAGSALLLTVAAVIINDQDAEITGLIVGTAAALGIYLRFGYLYAALASLICAAALPFQFDLAPAMERSIAAAVFLLVFFVARSGRLSCGDDFPGDDYGVIQAAAVAGAYLALNLQLFDTAPAGAFYWVTYAIIWIIPIVGLRTALRERDRPLQDVSLGMALVTLVTNKPYLGLVRKPWDPILFGIFLVAVAVMIRRWLSKAPGGQRYGFTHLRIFHPDRRAVDVVGTASAALQPDMPASTSAVPTTTEPEFGGGRSGGAGASGSF